jgi:hypothetical protein
MKTLRKTIAGIIFDFRKPPQVFMPILEKAMASQPLRLNGIDEYHRFRTAMTRSRE